MANTTNGIYYPDDGTKPADVLTDLKAMAESIDENIQTNNEEIKSEQEQQNSNINNNTVEIDKLRKENELLLSQIPIRTSKRRKYYIK